MESTSYLYGIELVKDYGVILLHNALSEKEQKALYEDLAPILKP